MTSLEKKAVQHCLDLLKNVETLKVWQVVNAALEQQQILLTEQKKVLDKVSDAHIENVNRYVNQAKEWLAELLKNEA